jgi:hypothetical protein
MNKTKQPAKPTSRMAASLTLGLLGCVTLWAFPGCHHVCYPTPIGMHLCHWFHQPATIPFQEPQKYSLYTSPQLAVDPPRRIVLVPTGTQARGYQAPIQFAESFSAAIRQSGICEIVLPSGVECRTTVDGILTGQFDEREIVQLARTWHCDAVMFVRVNQFQGFDPLGACVTAALVDANESVVLFAVDGNWDTADPEIKMGFEHFVTNRTLDSPETARQIQFQAPGNLFDYVAHQMSGALRTAAGY